MSTVGVRELRDGLSRYLAEVRTGQTVTVTDHGKPIARIVPVDRPTALERLVADGVVQPPTRRKGPLPEPVQIQGTVSDLVGEQRE